MYMDSSNKLPINHTKANVKFTTKSGVLNPLSCIYKTLEISPKFRVLEVFEITTNHN